MKKSLLIGLLSLAASAATTFGQSAILMDSYNTTGPYITYGASVPQNGVSGALGTPSGKIVGNSTGTSPWSAGLVFCVG